MPAIHVQQPAQGDRFRVAFKSTHFTPIAVPAFQYGATGVADNGVRYVAVVHGPDIATVCAQVVEVFPGAIIDRVFYYEGESIRLLPGHEFSGTQQLRPKVEAPPSIWQRLWARYFGATTPATDKDEHHA